MAWYKAIWHKIDDTLRSISRNAKKVVRILRIVRAFLATGILIVLATIVALFVLPEWVHLFFAISMLFLVIPLVMLLVLIQLPLMAKSIVRLIDKGYPDNARELAIRLAARKLHEQSIETEELLLDTAINEARKAKEYYGRKAKQLQAQLDALDDEAAAKAAGKAAGKAADKRAGRGAAGAAARAADAAKTADAPDVAGGVPGVAGKRCTGTTLSGDRCRRPARPGSDFCAQHSADEQ